MRSAWRDPTVLALSFSQLIVSAGLYYLFPALVLQWQQDFGWSLPQIMGAFSAALIVQGLTAKAVGRRLDRGLGPWLMSGGGILASIGLMALTQAQSLAAFYLIWATLGLVMGLTLYDAVFALLIRARGANAAEAIAVVTLIAGLASSLAFVISGIVGDIWGWRAVVSMMAVGILVTHVPIVLISTRRLARDACIPSQPETTRASPRSRPGYWSLTFAFSLSALGLGMVISHVLLLLSWTGVTPKLALIAAALIGVAQFGGRLAVALVGTSWNRRSLVTACLLGLMGALIALMLAPQWAGFVIIFACFQGACYGVSSALRPMLIRDVLGQETIGTSQGSVLAPAFISFGLAPLVAATTVICCGPIVLITLCSLFQGASAAILSGGLQLRRAARED